MSKIEFPGLNGMLVCERDVWGYPSVEVEDIAEGAYARGYLHALDRPVQVQLLMMMAQGRLMEILGDTPLSRMLDRAVRTHNFVGDLSAQASKLDRDAYDLLRAYSKGFNNCLRKTGAPLILKPLGIPLCYHSPACVLLLYRFLAFFGLTSMHQLAEGVIAGLVKDNADPALFEILLGDEVRGLDISSLSKLHLDRADQFLLPPLGGGSNAFAVSAERSATNGALLMSELHLQIASIPPAMYAVHTGFSDGNYYQGIGLPGLAWVSAGRTREIAWTYTFGHADNIDILVERCRDGQFLAADKWIPMRRREEKVYIRGRKEPEIWVYYDNDYGSIIGDAMIAGDYPCMRWSGLHQHTAGDINAARAAMQATNAESFAQIHRNIRILSLAAVAADTSGRIAYIQTGQVDQRPTDWTGAYPRKGWDLATRNPPTLPEIARPTCIDPTEGIIVSANERRDGPQGERWHTLPETDYRYRRLYELLTLIPRIEPTDLMRISYDEGDICARELLAVWSPFLPQQERLRDLCRWANNPTSPATRESRYQMKLFYLLYREVVGQLLTKYIGSNKVDRFFDQLSLLQCFQFHIDAVLRLEKQHLLNAKQLQNILATAWPIAIAKLDASDRDIELCTSFKHHLFRDALPSILGFHTKPITLPGGPHSPFQCRKFALQGEQMVVGPVFHLLFDLKQPGSLYNISGGASEKRLGAGFACGIESWQQGHFIRLGPDKLYNSIDNSK
jgi:penicillin amidase